MRIKYTLKYLGQCLAIESSQELLAIILHGSKRALPSVSHISGQGI